MEKNINFSSYVFGRKDRKWENRKLVYVSFVWQKRKMGEKKTIMICNNLLIFKVKNTILEIYDKNFNNPHISYNSSII